MESRAPAVQVAICAESGPYKAHSKTKKKQLDQHSYAAYLKDMATEARKVLGVGPATRVEVIQDNWRVHTAPAAKAAEVRYRLDVIEGQPVRSPDLNPIENVFAILSKRLDNLYMRPEKQNVLREEFEADVRETLQELAADGTISRICSSMPKRCERVIAQQGGPTKC